MFLLTTEAPLPASTVSSPRTFREPPWAGFVGFAAATVFYYLLRTRLLYGDAAIYARQMEEANFFERSLHLFYYVAGWAFIHLTRPLGMETGDALALLAGLSMAASLWMTWILYRELGEDRTIAAWGLGIFFFAGVVLQQGAYPEVYSLQLALSLAGYLAWLKGRPVLAGFALGLATLTTPLGVLAVGFFVVEAIRTRNWKGFAIVAVVGAVTFLSVLAFCWRDYFYGTRGLIVDKGGTSQSWTDLRYNAWALVKNFHWLMPFMAWGLWVAWRQRSRVLALLIGLLVFHIPAVATLTENGVFILPLYPLLAAVVARGVVAGLAHSALRVATGVALALYVVTAWIIWVEPTEEAFRVHLVEGLRRCPPGAMVLTNWSFSVTLDFYAGPPRDSLTASRRLVYPPVLDKDQVLAAMRAGQPVYLIEPHYPSRGVRWFYTAEMREQHYREWAFMPRMERALGVTGTEVYGPRGGPRVYRLSLR